MIYTFYLNVFQGFHVKPATREEKLQLPETGHGRLFFKSYFIPNKQQTQKESKTKTSKI